MNTVVIKAKNYITRKEVLANILENEGVCYLELVVYWDMANYENLNDMLEEFVEDGHMLMDVEYRPIHLDTKNGCLTMEATISDTTDYVGEEEKYWRDY